MTVAGLIFSNIHDQSIPEMTRMRTMASIPFGCRYRLIDFALSNMVNSGVNNVGVITHFNYQSLLDHIGNGKDWDLARRSGGIMILPPYIAAFENSAAGKLYASRLEAMMGAESFINRCGADYMVLADCDVLLNIDLQKVIGEHIRNDAYITLVTKDLHVGDHPFENDATVVTADENGIISEVSKIKPKRGTAEISTNIMIIRRRDLQSIISESLSQGYHSFTNDILRRAVKKKKVCAYRFDGYCAYVGSLNSYFANSMDLLKPDVRKDLLGNPDRMIFTKIRNSAPAKYSGDAKVRNSLIADGCVIEGTVENSILFRGVRVGKNTVVKNSILLQDTFLGGNVNLNCVITDKNVIVKDDRTLSGHESMPFFIGKGVTV